MSKFIDLFLHLDVHLSMVIQTYGTWTYLILFLIIFCETGLVVTPILPGDSLLFAAGAFASRDALHIGWLWLLLSLAAIIGDTINYYVGYYAGQTIIMKWQGRWIKPKYIEQTRAFYDRHGGKTIIIARFVPIVRTFAPFVAGIGRMRYRKFIAYNIIGGLLWVTTLLFAGYFFGNIPVVEKNFTLVIFGIIGISIMPGVIKFIAAKFNQLKQSQSQDE